MSCSVSPEDQLEIRRLSLVNVMAQTGQKPACFVAPANYRQGDDDLAGLLAGALDVPNHRLSALFQMDVLNPDKLQPAVP